MTTLYQCICYYQIKGREEDSMFIYQLLKEYRKRFGFKTVLIRNIRTNKLILLWLFISQSVFSYSNRLSFFHKDVKFYDLSYISLFNCSLLRR